MSSVLTTNSGRRFDLDAPTADMISIDDIAVALGNTCRFGGHSRHFYSVAEHSMLVCTLVRKGGEPHSVALAALLHDAHEYVLGDVPTPLKAKIMREAPGVWEQMEGAINTAIADAFGFDVAWFDHPAVHWADRQALYFEAAMLKSELLIGGEPVDLEPHREEAKLLGYVEGLKPEDAAVDFLAYFGVVLDRYRRG